MTTPGAGGWGAPAEREPERVRADVSDGVITAERAEAQYGSGWNGERA